MGKVKYAENQVLKAGVYDVKVESIDDDDGEYGPQFKFIFGVTAGRSAGQQIYGWASQKLGPKTKLMAWTKALMPEQEIGPRFELDTDWLVGREARMVVGVGVGNNGNERNTIDSLLPIEVDEAEPEPGPPPEDEAPHPAGPAPVPPQRGPAPLPQRQPVAAAPVRSPSRTDF